MPPVIRCTLSGSFHRDRPGLQSIYYELVALGCQVLSPHRLDFNDVTETFVRDSAEHSMAAASLEQHHLLSIAQSDFLWVHAPSGYIGLSTVLEIGYALGRNIPVFSTSTITDEVVSSLVEQVDSAYKVLERLYKQKTN